MLNISEAVLAKRLTCSNECEYLYNIYDKEINSIVCNEYGFNCPPLVSDLISKLAHNNDELQKIFKNKLFYKYYIHMYGNGSFYKKKFAILNTLSVSFTLLDFHATSFKYWFNNFVTTSASFIIPSIAYLFHKHIVKRILRNTNFKTIHTHALSLTKRKDKLNVLQNVYHIASYYKTYFNKRNVMYCEACLDSTLVNGVAFVEYIGSYFIPESIKSNYLSICVHAICSNIFGIIAVTPSVPCEDVKLPPGYPNNHVGPSSITTILLEPIAGRNVKLMFRLWVTGYSLFKWYKSIMNTKALQRKENYLGKLYFMQRIVNLYPTISDMMSHFAPSYSIHLNKLPFVNGFKMISVALHYISSFVSFGFTYQQKNNGKPNKMFWQCIKCSGENDMNSPVCFFCQSLPPPTDTNEAKGDIFEWSYQLL